jgi:hypothetical protein
MKHKKLKIALYILIPAVLIAISCAIYFIYKYKKESKNADIYKIELSYRTDAWPEEYEKNFLSAYTTTLDETQHYEAFKKGQYDSFFKDGWLTLLYIQKALGIPDITNKQDYLYPLDYWGVMDGSLLVSIDSRTFHYASDDKYKKPNNNWLTNIYYVSLDSKPKIKLGQLQKTEFFNAIVTKEKNLSKFIADQNYCDIDDDCILRYDYCEYGASNYFTSHPMMTDVYGCEGCQMHKNITKENEIEMNKITEDPAINKCGKEQIVCVEFQYDGTKCENNKCIPVNQKIKGFTCN